jgi:acetyltransferase-like isoleucine patch superfamily enzyme
MRVIALIRGGEGPFWGGLKRMIKAALRLHIPMGPVTRPVYRFLYNFRFAVRMCWALLVRFLWCEPLFRSQCTSVGSGVVIDSLPGISGHGKIILGDGVQLSGASAFAFFNRWNDSPELIVGDHTFIGNGCIFVIGSSIRIGRHCLFAGGVRMADYDGHPTDAMRRRTEPSPPEAIMPIVIGDDVWIGADSRILKGVTIGDRSIVGAGAIVTKSVPSDVVVAGNPARVVKSLRAPCNGASPPVLAGCSVGQE